MKATFTGKANGIRRPRSDFSTTDMVEIDLDMNGKVDSRNLGEQPTTFRGTLQVKQLVADKIAFGSTFTITIDDGAVEQPKPTPNTSEAPFVQGDPLLMQSEILGVEALT